MRETIRKYWLLPVVVFALYMATRHTDPRSGVRVRWVGRATNSFYEPSADVRKFVTNGSYETGLCDDGTVVWRNREAPPPTMVTLGAPGSTNALAAPAK